MDGWKTIFNFWKGSFSGAMLNFGSVCSLQSKFDPWVFSTNLLYVGLPRKAFPGKQAKVDTGHSVFVWLHKQRPKIRPRPAQLGYFNERTW